MRERERETERLMALDLNPCAYNSQPKEDNSTTVIAVRGTFDFLDVLNDVALWLVPALMQVLNLLGPDISSGDSAHTMVQNRGFPGCFLGTDNLCANYEASSCSVLLFTYRFLMLFLSKVCRFHKIPHSLLD